MADYLEEVDHVAARILKLEQSIDEAVEQAPAGIKTVMEALQALCGVAQTTAAPIVSELGSLSRFQSPRQLMGYSGLVASEHSSGNRVQRGGITKTGNARFRRVLVEAASAYRHRPNVTLGAGTVLAVKGSLRRAKQRRALDYCAPFGRIAIATGGSGGNTSRPAAHGLDRVAPYQNVKCAASCRNRGLPMVC